MYEYEERESRLVLSVLVHSKLFRYHSLDGCFDLHNGPRPNVQRIRHVARGSAPHLQPLESLPIPFADVSGNLRVVSEANGPPAPVVATARSRPFGLPAKGRLAVHGHTAIHAHLAFRLTVPFREGSLGAHLKNPLSVIPSHRQFAIDLDSPIQTARRSCMSP